MRSCARESDWLGGVLQGCKLKLSKSKGVARRLLERPLLFVVVGEGRWGGELRGVRGTAEKRRYFRYQSSAEPRDGSKLHLGSWALKFVGSGLDS